MKSYKKKKVSDYYSELVALECLAKIIREDTNLLPNIDKDKIQEAEEALTTLRNFITK